MPILIRIFIISFIFILLVGVSFWYAKDIYFPDEKPYRVFIEKENSFLSPDSTVSKGDSLSYHIILEKNIGENIQIDTSPFEEKIKISQLFIDGEEVENLLDIPGKENTQIIIVGESLSDQTGNIDISYTKQQEKEEKISPIEENRENISEIFLSKKRFFADFNNLVEISGTGLEDIKFIIIGEQIFPLQQHENMFFVSLPKDTFSSGEYFVLFQNNFGQIFTFPETIFFDHSPESINILDITPKQFSAGTQKNIVVQGRGFNKIVSIQLSNNLIFEQTNFQIISDKILVVAIPDRLPIGTYYFNIMTPEKIHPFSHFSFTITN